MPILGVIPARFGSTRLPAKPLLSIDGRPLVAWVYEAAARANVFDDVIVATDHVDIRDCAARFGARVMMTSPELQSGTDRVAEVAEAFPQHDVVVNVQGDQPFVTPEMLHALVEPYQRGETPDMTTLACPLDWETAYRDEASVKVVVDRQGYALYFSRSPIPFLRTKTDRESLPVLHHLGLYAYRRSFLLKFTEYAPTPLERCESLEQLRALEYGHRILVCRTSKATIEINTPDDLTSATRLLAQQRGRAT
jgi:3-deoxy-manno-octulosonate cytidylyltransferase (CMP-KDO synthetase)